jgi:hypothetical protein
MRPITTQSFLTDLHTLKEAITSDSDVKKSETTGQLRTLYLHEKLANFAQDFFRGSESKIKRHQHYKDSAKTHIAEKMAEFISTSIKNEPVNDAFNRIYNNAKETIKESSKNLVTSYTDSIEKNGNLAIGAMEINKITEKIYPSSNLNKKERENLTAIQSEFSKIDTLVATVLPAASWIKENIGWEGDQAVKFARMMSDPELKNLPKKVQFEIAGKVLDLTRKFINSGSSNGSESGAAKTKAEIKTFQEEKFKLLAKYANNPIPLTEAAAVRWIDNFYPDTKPDQKTTLAKKMLKVNLDKLTAQEKYNLVLIDLTLKVGPANPEKNPSLN